MNQVGSCSMWISNSQRCSQQSILKNDASMRSFYLDDWLCQKDPARQFCKSLLLQLPYNHESALNFEHACSSRGQAQASSSTFGAGLCQGCSRTLGLHWRTESGMLCWLV